MFNFFGRKDKEKKEPESQNRDGKAAPGTQIRYDPELIDKLHEDHQQLIALYGAISKSFEQGDYLAVATQLADFRTGLQAHLLTENVRLYIYLEHMLAGDPANFDLIHNFRHEMDGIGRTAMGFLKKYEAIGVDQDLAPSFQRDFATIGEVLTKRIKAEEGSLYPLYLPNY